MSDQQAQNSAASNAPPADPAASAAASAAEKAGKTVKVRMLVDHGDHKCGRLAVFDADTAKQLVRDGVADDNKAAVAYAEKLEKTEPAAP